MPAHGQALNIGSIMRLVRFMIHALQGKHLTSVQIVRCAHWDGLKLAP